MKEKLEYEFVSWDKFVWSKVLKKIGIDEVLFSNEDKTLIEIGSRDLLLAKSMSNKKITVLSTDFNNPSKIGLKNIKKYNLNFQKLNVLDIKDLNNKFDIIFIKSVLGGACKSNDDLKLAFNNIKKISKPNTKIYLIENLYVSKFHSFLRSLIVPWGNKWNYLRNKDILDQINLIFEIEAIYYFGILSWMTPSKFKKISFYFDLIFNWLPNKYKYVVGFKLTLK